VRALIAFLLLMLCSHRLTAQLTRIKQSKDTTQAEKKLSRRVLQFSPERIRLGLASGDTFKLDARTTVLQDEIDTLDGHVQTLGQIGKPYQRFRYGLNDYYLQHGLYRDPMTNRPEVYIWNPATQLPYLDTKSPLVNVQFDFGTREMELFRFTISQNVTPYWNASVHYRRRTAQGPYLSFNTDHYNIAFSNYIHSRKGRFTALVSGAFANLQDQMNGGVRYSLSPNEFYQKLEADLLLPGGTTAPSQGVAGIGADLLKRVRHLYVFSSYKLVDAQNTRISLLATTNLLDHYRRYRDQISRLDTNSLLKQTPTVGVPLYRIYGRIYPDTLRGWKDEYYVTNFTLSGGARYEQRLAKFWITNQLEIENQQTNYRDTLQAYSRQDRRTLRYTGMLRWADSLQILNVKWQSETTVSTLFGPEYKLSGELNWGFPGRFETLADTFPILSARETAMLKRPVTNPVFYAPLLLTASFATENRNPSVWDRYWGSYTFRRDSSLTNETLTHLKVGLRISGRPKTKNGVPFLQSYIGVTMFNSLITRPIFYDSLAQPRQSNGTDNLLWVGGTLDGRIRLWRFYLEGSATYQSGRTNNETLLKRYTNNQPNAYARGSIYFQKRVLREGLSFVTLGIDGWYFGEHSPHTFEPSTQVFYPQFDYRMPGYARFDVYAAAHVKFAVFYIKMQHVNEGMLGPGYMTTPFYPMMERVLWIGFNWNFFN